MIDTNNPAGRLYQLLQTARKKPEKEKVRNVWAEVFECKPQDDANISKSVVEVYNLSQDVQRLIKLIPGLNHKLYLSSFNKINKAIFPLNLNASWQAQRAILSDEVLTRLQFCAEVLSKHYSEESLSAEDLEEIDNLIKQTFELVESSGIEVSLRMAILEELERIRSSISMYRIKGAKGVKEALQSLFGAVIVNQEALDRLKGRNEDVLERIGMLIDKLDAFTARALKIKRIMTGPVGLALNFLSGSENGGA